MHLKSLHDLDRTEGNVRLREATTNATLNKGGDIILLPHPTANDPNDPLAWPTWRKHIAFGAVCAFAFIVNYGIGGTAPAFFVISQEFHRTPADTSQLLSWAVLVLGAFNFFWVPLAGHFGKRPVFLFASLLYMCCMIWGAVATGFKSLLWSSIVAAFAGSASEAVAVAVVNDLYFVHERGTKMGVYVLAISAGNSLGPLICGFVTESIGWRWHKWLAMISTACLFLAILFGVPETTYQRDYLVSLGALSADNSGTQTPEATEATEEGLKKVTTRTHAVTESQFNDHVPQKTYLQQLKIVEKPAGSLSSLLFNFIRPFPLIVHPAIILAFFGYALSLAWVVIVNVTAPFILSAPPYNFNTAIQGLINVPGFLGNLAGAVIGGWLCDAYIRRATTKNNGIFEPEMRLPLMIVSVIIVPAGLLAFGYGAGKSLHWTATYFGYGMISVGLAAVPSSTMTYVSDCLLPVGPDALLLVNGLKNIVAFGFIYAANPWVESQGYINMFGAQAGIYVAIVGLGGLATWYWGKGLRETVDRWNMVLED